MYVLGGRDEIVKEARIQIYKEGKKKGLKVEYVRVKKRKKERTRNQKVGRKQGSRHKG